MKKNGLLLALIVALCPLILTAQMSENLKKGIELFGAEKYTESKTFFTEDIKNGSENFESYVHLGKILAHEGNFEKATEMFIKSVEINPQSSDAHLWLGISYLGQMQNASFMEQGIYSGKALDNYKKAIELDPYNIEARIRLANYYINAPSIAGGSVKRAKEQAEEIIKYSPSEGQKLMAEIYIKEDKMDLALEMYSELIKNEPNNTDLYYQLGMLHQKTKNFEEAFNTFEKALKIDPKAFDSMYQIGRTSVFSKQNLDRGIESFKEYLKFDQPSGLPGHDSVHWRLGMLYEIKSEKDLAKAEYEKAVKLNPEDNKYKEALAKLN
ncbi:tetratricopeptide repeat protein [Bacteroidota bacterium]